MFLLFSILYVVDAETKSISLSNRVYVLFFSTPTSFHFYTFSESLAQTIFSSAKLFSKCLSFSLIRSFIMCLMTNYTPFRFSFTLHFQCRLSLLLVIAFLLRSSSLASFFSFALSRLSSRTSETITNAPSFVIISGLRYCYMQKGERRNGLLCELLLKMWQKWNFYRHQINKQWLNQGPWHAVQDAAIRKRWNRSELKTQKNARNGRNLHTEKKTHNRDVRKWREEEEKKKLARE